MLTKNWNAKTGRFDVTFDLPADLDIEQAAVVGEFNDWSESSDPMSKGANGSWSATVPLEPSRSYRFRYHLGEDRWENDWNADRYERNDFGGSDSVVTTPEAPMAPPAATSATTKQAAPKKAAPKKAAPKKAAGKKAAAPKKAAETAKKAKKSAKKATKRPPA